jgi:hypothetical protein
MWLCLHSRLGDACDELPNPQATSLPLPVPPGRGFFSEKPNTRRSSADGPVITSVSAFCLSDPSVRPDKLWNTSALFATDLRLQL